MKRYDWTWGGMGENSNGGWVRYDDAQQAIAEAERRVARETRRAIGRWLHGRGYGKSSAALKQALDGGEFDEPRQPEPPPPHPDTVVEMCDTCGLIPALGNRVYRTDGSMSRVCPSCNPSKPPKPTTVIEMVEEALMAGGYDGLAHSSRCQCKLGDLSPTGCLDTSCVAARNDPKQAKVEGTDFWMVPARVKT